jgi:hypothetical protein
MIGGRHLENVAVGEGREPGIETESEEHHCIPAE